MATVKAMAGQSGYDNGQNFNALHVLLDLDGREHAVAVHWDGDTVADAVEALRLLADRLEAEHADA